MTDQHAPRYDAPGRGVFAPALLKALSEQAGDDFIATCDVGQHQMWVAQHCRFSRPQAHLTSGGLGTMGYGIPAGIGALFAEPDATVVTVTGDGSIMMNIQELATLTRYRLPLKIVLLDNSQLGMVRQWQELFFEENFSEIDLYDNPDFAELARSFGLEAFTVDRRDEVAGAIDRLLAAKGPILAHVRIDPRENVWPLVPPGASNSQMMEA
jgi:acetolactate synthase-1/2/3 large subunit